MGQFEDLSVKELEEELRRALNENAWLKGLLGKHNPVRQRGRLKFSVLTHPNKLPIMAGSTFPVAANV